MNLKSVFLFLCCLWMAMTVSAQHTTQVVAHRGYWKVEGSAQNSVRSLECAHAIDAYGAEFDVHLTADNVLVIFHDNKIEGKEIQTSTYKELKNLRLANGEKLPTLKKYLKKAKKLKNIHLVFELKPHATPQRNQEAAQASVALIEKMKLADRTDYISFNLDACKEIIRIAPQNKVFYLNGELDPQALKQMGFAGLDYYYKTIQEHPEWIKQCHDLQLQTNVWTVNEEAVMQEMIDLGLDYITTNEPETLQKLLKK